MAAPAPEQEPAEEEPPRLTLPGEEERPRLTLP